MNFLFSMSFQMEIYREQIRQFGGAKMLERMEK